MACRVAAVLAFTALLGAVACAASFVPPQPDLMPNGFNGTFLIELPGHFTRSKATMFYDWDKKAQAVFHDLCPNPAVADRPCTILFAGDGNVFYYFPRSFTCCTFATGIYPIPPTHFMDWSYVGNDTIKVATSADGAPVDAWVFAKGDFKLWDRVGDNTHVRFVDPVDTVVWDFYNDFVAGPQDPFWFAHPASCAASKCDFSPF